MLRTLSAAASVGGILYYKTTVLHPARCSLLAQEAQAPLVQYMAAPMSDLSGVTYNSEMRLRMEAFIMSLQHDFCRALEAEEAPGHRFRVDRWTREEGGGGVTCIIQD